jgi:hypothetical protein
MGYPVAGAATGHGYCGHGLGGVGTFCTSIGARYKIKSSTKDLYLSKFTNYYSTFQVHVNKLW